MDRIKWNSKQPLSHLWFLGGWGGGGSTFSIFVQDCGILHVREERLAS